MEGYPLNLLNWLEATDGGKFIFTMLVSMIPVAELRVGLPFGVGLGLPYWKAFAAAVLGNIIPAPFIIVYIRRIFHWLRTCFPKLDGFVTSLENKARRKSGSVVKYDTLGLLLFVGIPLPGTGVWTGCLVAAMQDMQLKRAMPSVIAGVIMAGLIMTGLTHVGINLFTTVMG
jgi:uncharacterized membrane protein